MADDDPAPVPPLDLPPHRTPLGEDEKLLLRRLRQARRKRRLTDAAAPPPELTVGQRVADQVAAMMGSWPFIIVQTSILLVWIVLNVTAYIRHWDPYPFILLNLALSFQAAYAAPFIMMSQNRQQEVDRQEAANDYKVNVKAELEIELLHDKIDQLREKEIVAVTQAVEALTLVLNGRKPPEPAVTSAPS